MGRRQLLAASLAVVAAACSTPPKPVEVEVRSHPPGAAVFRAHDDTRLGITPCTVTVPGKEREASFRLELDGYRPETIAVDATQNHSLEPVQLRPALTGEGTSFWNPLTGRAEDPTKPSPLVPVRSVQAVSRSALGQKWPLTVESGYLQQRPHARDAAGPNVVTFLTGDGQEYALNDAAAARGYPAIDPLLVVDGEEVTSELRKKCFELMLRATQYSK